MTHKRHKPGAGTTDNNDEEIAASPANQRIESEDESTEDVGEADEGHESTEEDDENDGDQSASDDEAVGPIPSHLWYYVAGAALIVGAIFILSSDSIVSPGKRSRSAKQKNSGSKK